MPKQGGMGSALWVDGFDVSGDINSLSEIGGGNSPLDMTSIVHTAYDRQAGIRDGRMTLRSYLNPSAGSAHVKLAALPYTDRTVSYAIGPIALGTPVANVVSKQANYDANRAADGNLLFDTQVLGNGFGLEWSELLTAGIRVDGGATNGTPVDFAAGTAFGLQAFLHVFAFTGTDATIKLQESSDNGADAYADVVGGGFTVTNVGNTPRAQRIQTARALTVERFLRVVTTTAGGFSSLSFTVSVAKNITSAVFNG